MMKIININCVILVFLITIISCNSDDCIVIEKYNNGTSKFIACDISSLGNDFCYKKYYPDGVLEAEYCMLNEKLNGEVISYYPSKILKSKTEYNNGLKHGSSFFYFPDGRIEQYIINHNDSPIYRKDFSYESSKTTTSEGYMPIFSLKQKKIDSSDNQVEFEVTLPIPDSLSEGKEFVFSFQAKPASMKDSILLNPRYTIPLDNKEKKSGVLKLEALDTQFFYGHLYDKKNNHIYYPIERELIFN